MNSPTRMTTRPTKLQPQETILAPYAVTAANSVGRAFHEDPPAWRTEFQRDRDRIVHCSAFRRLEYKTQVFVNHEGDMFRTRLTHSLEIAQISRSVARALRLNEDLTEAIALAHDLGHTPFGHAGQSALNSCMAAFGGFEHNLQSLRVVDVLEQRYPDFSGLNLMFDTREGILKHCSVVKARELGEVGRRFIDGSQPSLEAQIANVADEIGYNHHDLDDGLRAGLLHIDGLREFPLFKSTESEVMARWPTLDSKRVWYTVIRRMLNFFVSDLIETTLARLADRRISTVSDVRDCAVTLLDFRPEVKTAHLELKRILRKSLYEHARVVEMADNSRKVVHELFDFFMHDPRLVPVRAAPHDDASQARIVADYIAGMTDRFAIAEHARLMGKMR